MRDAVLLVGPTGSGKSPLGDLLERRGYRGRTCRHLDFGRALREAAADGGRLSPAARDVVRRVLAEGALLEDDEFFVAEEILDAFLGDPAADARTVVVLNGLPRHVGQADAVARRLRVVEVVHLDATREVLHARIRENRGGDRGGRRDDERAAVAARLARFERRTRPLLEHYGRRGVPVRRLDVGLETTAPDLLGALGA